MMAEPAQHPPQRARTCRRRRRRRPPGYDCPRRRRRAGEAGGIGQGVTAVAAGLRPRQPGLRSMKRPRHVRGVVGALAEDRIDEVRIGSRTRPSRRRAGAARDRSHRSASRRKRSLALPVVSASFRRRARRASSSSSKTLTSAVTKELRHPCAPGQPLVFREYRDAAEIARVLARELDLLPRHVEA